MLLKIQETSRSLLKTDDSEVYIAGVNPATLTVCDTKNHLSKFIAKQRRSSLARTRFGGLLAEISKAQEDVHMATLANPNSTSKAQVEPVVRKAPAVLLKDLPKQ